MSKTRLPLEEARQIADRVVAELSPYLDRVEVAGSIRRRAELVGDIEVVAVPSEVSDDLFGAPRLAIAEVRELAEGMGRVAKAGEKMIQVEQVLGTPLTLDLFLVTPPATWGAILAIRTGPAEVSQLLVTSIRGRLMRCQDGRVTDITGQQVPTDTEEEFFRAAGIPWVPPEERTPMRLMRTTAGEGAS